MFPPVVEFLSSGAIIIGPNLWGWLMCCVLLLEPLCGSNGDGMCTPWVSPVPWVFTHGCGPSHLRRSFMAQQRFSVTGDFWRLIIGAACLCASLATAPRFRYGGYANRGLRPQWTSPPAIIHPHLRCSSWLFFADRTRGIAALESSVGAMEHSRGCNPRYWRTPTQ